MMNSKPILKPLWLKTAEAKQPMSMKFDPTCSVRALTQPTVFHHHDGLGLHSLPVVDWKSQRADPYAYAHRVNSI